MYAIINLVSKFFLYYYYYHRIIMTALGKFKPWPPLRNRNRHCQQQVCSRTQHGPVTLLHNPAQTIQLELVCPHDQWQHRRPKKIFPLQV